MKRAFSLRPSPRDPRDWRFSAIVRAPAVLPSSVDLTAHCGPVRDQGEAGFCHSFGGAEIKNIHEHLETGAVFDLSPLYLAKMVKSIDGLPETEGSTLVSVCRALAEFGTCKEAYYPYEGYTVGSLRFPEPAREYPVYKIGGYSRLYTVPEMRESLALGKPVLYGITVCQNFYDAGDFVPMPFGFVLGRHAMVLVGYDDAKDFGDGHVGYFRTKNSYGKSWGVDGYSWIPYDYFTARYTVIKEGDGRYFDGDAWNLIDLQNDPIRGRMIEMRVGNREITVNGVKKEIDQPPFIVPETGRAVAPVRAIAEALGCDVMWNGNGTIRIFQEGE